MMRRKYKTIVLWSGTFVLVVVVATSYIFWQRAASNKTYQQHTISATETLRQLLALTDNDHIRGEVRAPVTVIEYADIECKFCKGFASTFDNLYQTYGVTGQVRFVFRHFPLGLWGHSVPEAVAAECASEQKGSSGFYTYLSKLFALTPSENGLNLSVLPQIAADMGLDAYTFAQCTADPAIKERIDSEHVRGLAAGVSIAPTTFVIGPTSVTKVAGNKSYKVFTSLIEAALHANSASP